ncbi:MAG: hypothetical protein JWO94_2473 [Verrucomicrobiaceae bacterium]|nr:hypothetical protein [Verrucomicrobiaceae bacterium]
MSFFQRCPLFLLLAAACQARPLEVAPDPLKHLMLDTRVIYHAVNARLVPGAMVKEPRNPLFQADRPWENATNNLYPNVLWDEQEQMFKMWYKCVLADKQAIARMDQPSTVHDVGWYLLYATSKDGLVWDKPALGLHRFDGDAATNIVTRDTPNAGVFKDLHDPDAARRYKMIYDVGLGQPRVRFSADGIHWGEAVTPEGFGAQYGDTHTNAFWDERSHKYLCFTKLYMGERTIARLESNDFLHWQASGMVLRSTVEEGKTRQTYCLPVFRYANVYLGYTMMYNSGTDRSVDCELAWSPDSLHWQRVAPGRPFIPRGPRGGYDSECIYAMAGPAVADGNNLMIFYGGDFIPHMGWKRSCIPCLGRLPLDHFAGYEQADKTLPANLFTAQFRITGQPLRITADAAGGALRIAAVDEVAATLDNCQDITTNVISQEVQWRHGGLKDRQGQILHLQFELTGGAKLYAFSGLEMLHEAPPVALNPLRSPHRKPASLASKTLSFDTDAQGWKGVDKIEHHAEGGAKGGYISVSRSGTFLPIAFSPFKPAETPFAGDWSQLFGGNGARITFQARATGAGGKVRLELFAGDVAQWSHESEVSFTPQWTDVTTRLHYDWTDAEASAAGWVRSGTGFSWADTITHVGKIVVTSGIQGALDRFDLDEVTVSGDLGK